MCYINKPWLSFEAGADFLIFAALEIKGRVSKLCSWHTTNNANLLLWSYRLKALRQKKERLGYAVERLTLQSQQRQRQLRMSVNVPAP